jgi:hypothetical protein
MQRDLSTPRSGPGDRNSADSSTPHGVDTVEIFAGLDEAGRARLAAELETLSLKRGEVLRQGDMADALYVVLTGRFAVTVAGHRQAIAELGPGQPVGEIAFLAGGVRTATVTALRDSVGLRLKPAEFEELSARSAIGYRSISMSSGELNGDMSALRPTCTIRRSPHSKVAGDEKGLVASTTNMTSWSRLLVPALKTSIGVSAPCPFMDWPASA